MLDPELAKISEEAMSRNRICRKCFLFEQAEADKQFLQKYVDAVRPEDRLPKEQYMARLEICRGCEMLLEATCRSCGCYVEIRALVEHSHCPKKKW